MKKVIVVLLLIFTIPFAVQIIADIIYDKTNNYYYEGFPTFSKDTFTELQIETSNLHNVDIDQIMYSKHDFIHIKLDESLHDIGGNNSQLSYLSGDTLHHIQYYIGLEQSRIQKKVHSVSDLDYLVYCIPFDVYINKVFSVNWEEEVDDLGLLDTSKDQAYIIESTGELYDGGYILDMIDLSGQTNRNENYVLLENEELITIDEYVRNETKQFISIYLAKVEYVQNEDGSTSSNIITSNVYWVEVTKDIIKD